MKRIKRLFSVLVILTLMFGTSVLNHTEVSAEETSSTGVYLDPLTVSPISYAKYLNENNMRVTADSALVTATGKVLANTSVTSGKWYWEVEAINYPYIGYNYGNFGIASDKDCLAYYGTGYYKSGGDHSSYGTRISSGDIIGILLDADKGTINFSNNGVFQGVLSFDKNTFGNTITPVLHLIVANADMRVNFGAKTLKYVDTIPSGYIPYSLSEPIKLVASTVDNQIKLNWNAIEGATSYKVKRAETSGGPYSDLDSTNIVTTGEVISFIDKSAEKGKTYYYVVTACALEGESPYSNEVSTKLQDNENVLKVVLEVEEELQLSVDDDLTENMKLYWTSSDTNVATVDKNGVVTALNPGNTVITVKNKRGTYIDKINVLVLDDASNYRLAVDLKVGKTCRLTIDDYTFTKKVIWTSMDSTVAAVNSKGKVTAVGEGLTLMTVTDSSGKEIGQIYVRVRI